MPQWGNTDDAANSVNYGTELLRSGPIGSGNAAKAANNTTVFNNVTSGAFVSKATIGQFGVSIPEAQNASGEGHYAAHAGWCIRIAGTGGIDSIAVSAAGATFGNGETITFSNGSANGTGVVTSNSTGGMTSVSVSNPGSGFVNAASVAATFNREQHLASITVGGTPTGYSNTDLITASNGTVDGTATVSTNSTGGFVTANLTITNVGLWPAATTNAQVSFAVTAANGSASAGSGATFAAGLANSSGGTVTVSLGGRAGRVSYETIVAMKTLTDGTADDDLLPQA